MLTRFRKSSQQQAPATPAAPAPELPTGDFAAEMQGLRDQAELVSTPDEFRGLAKAMCDAVEKRVKGLAKADPDSDPDTVKPLEDDPSSVAANADSSEDEDNAFGQSPEEDDGETETVPGAPGISKSDGDGESKFDKLVAKLKEKGHSQEEAEGIAAHVGIEKYGKRGMERRAARGRALAKGVTPAARIGDAVPQVVEATPLIEALGNEIGYILAGQEELTAKIEAQNAQLTKSLEALNSLTTELGLVKAQIGTQTELQQGLAKSIDTLRAQPRGTVSGAAPLPPSGVRQPDIQTGPATNGDAPPAAEIAGDGWTRTQLIKGIHQHVASEHNTKFGTGIDVTTINSLDLLSQPEIDHLIEVCEREKSGYYEREQPATA